MALFMAELVRVAQTGVLTGAPALPATVALCDLRARLDTLATPVQVARWVGALCRYFWYQAWEASHRARRTVPTMDAYLVARITNGAMPPSVMSLDIASGFEVPAAEMEQPPLRALSEMCCALVGFDNDIMSHWKETLRSGDGLNLIDVMAASTGRAPRAVLPDAVTLRDRVLACYLRLRERSWPGLSEAGRRYVALLDRWIRGNLDWSLRTPRYASPGRPADLPGAIAARPTTTDPAPLPWPGVSWWWSVPAR
jgi:hypothetical protein